MTATNATATRQGRNLAIRFGDDTDHVDLLIRPASAADGLRLLTHLAQLNAANFGDPDVAALAVDDAEEMYRLAFGDTADDHPALDILQTLRDEEQQVAFTAAMVWNAKGGSFASTQQYLADGDRPAALTRMLLATGLVELG